MVGFGLCLDHFEQIANSKSEFTSELCHNEWSSYRRHRDIHLAISFAQIQFFRQELRLWKVHKYFV